MKIRKLRTKNVFITLVPAGRLILLQLRLSFKTINVCGSKIKLKPQTSNKYRLLNGTYRLPCLLHQYCEQPQQKKKEKKPIMSGASSRHITKLKQSILLRCLWLKLAPNFISNSNDSIFNFFSPEMGLNFSPEVELKVTKKR